MSRWQVYGPRIFDTVAFSRALFSYIPKYDFYIPNATTFSKATELLYAARGDNSKFDRPAPSPSSLWGEVQAARAIRANAGS